MPVRQAGWATGDPAAVSIWVLLARVTYKRLATTEEQGPNTTAAYFIKRLLQFLFVARVDEQMRQYLL